MVSATTWIVFFSLIVTFNVANGIRPFPGPLGLEPFPGRFPYADGIPDRFANPGFPFGDGIPVGYPFSDGIPDRFLYAGYDGFPGGYPGGFPAGLPFPGFPYGDGIPGPGFPVPVPEPVVVREPVAVPVPEPVGFPGYGGFPPPPIVLVDDNDNGLEKLLPWLLILFSNGC